VRSVSLIVSPDKNARVRNRSGGRDNEEPLAILQVLRATGGFRLSGIEWHPGRKRRFSRKSQSRLRYVRRGVPAWYQRSCCKTDHIFFRRLKRATVFYGLVSRLVTHISLLLLWITSCAKFVGLIVLQRVASCALLQRQIHLGMKDLLRKHL